MKQKYRGARQIRRAPLLSNWLLRSRPCQHRRRDTPSPPEGLRRPRCCSRRDRTPSRRPCTRTSCSYDTCLSFAARSPSPPDAAHYALFPFPRLLEIQRKSNSVPIAVTSHRLIAAEVPLELFLAYSVRLSRNFVAGPGGEGLRVVYQ